MSQSKMSANNPQQFTIRHVFENVDKMKGGDKIDGPIEYHYNIPWRLRIDKNSSDDVIVYFDCSMKNTSTDWSIEAVLNVELITDSPVPSAAGYYVTYFRPGKTSIPVDWIYPLSHQQCIIDGKITVEITVRIDEITGSFEKKKLRSFDDESAKKCSDVVLTVGSQKFYVYKRILSTYCAYFDSLFFGNVSESEKSEIELKDINPDEFQDFLEFLYLESAIEAGTVLRILHLADSFNSKTVIRRCQEFLIKKSSLSLKEKLETAVKYDLEELKTKCDSEIKIAADLESSAPKEGVQYGDVLWYELFQKSFSPLQK